MDLEYEKIYTEKIDIETIQDPILIYKSHWGRQVMNSIFIVEKTFMDIYDIYSLKNFKEFSLLNNLNEVSVFPYLNFNDSPTNVNSHSNMNARYIVEKKPKIILKLDKIDNEYYKSYYYKMGRNYKTESRYTLIKDEMHKLTNETIFKMEIMSNTGFMNQENNINLPLLNKEVNRMDLYNYQLNDIFWMKQIENKEFKISGITYNGGNLISEMGLGKSIIVLSFILNQENDYDKYISSYSSFCNYFYKRGALMHSCCIKKVKNDKLYCNEHDKRNFHDKLNMNLNFELINSDNGMYKFIKNGFLVSNASIIICPEHIGDQWCMEYYNKIRSTRIKRIIMVLTLAQYNNLTIADILFADIIIMSFDMFFKFNNISGVCRYDDITNRLTVANISFYNFHFKRVFLDEIHQIGSETVCSSLIKQLKSDFVWNITGTPYINGLKGYLQMLSYNTNIDISIYKSTEENMIKNVINSLQVLFKRNTKQSINIDILSVFNNVVKLLDFTEPERELYNGYIIGNASPYSDKIRKLCCDPELYEKTRKMLESCNSLSEIRDVIYKQLMNEIKTIDETIILLRNEISNIQTSIDNPNLRHYKTSLTVQLKNKENKQKTINYMQENITETVQTEMCCICLDDITDVCITKCGHKYCRICVEKFIEMGKRNRQDYIKCPQCNTILKENEIYIVEENKNSIENNNELYNIIQNVKSTKIGNIIYHIKYNLKTTDKIIIFSQWDELLHKVGKKISEYFNVLYCNGTLYQKNKAIKAFNQEPDKQVIMLSCRNSACGINLSIANKIIFIEPIYGDLKFRQETENQAIGRANRIGNKNKTIEVMKFIIKDTIEQDIYEDNVNESKMLN
jgi:SNF2 family DNA or RNA helicase